MLALKFIGWILKALKEGPTPGQLTGGILLGFITGLIPGWPLQVWILLLLILILKVNLSMVIVGWFFGIVAGLIIDPLLDTVGGWILQADSLREMWTALYNSPPWALTHFNNTVVMGSLVVGLLTSILAFPMLTWAVKAYRTRFLARITQFKFVQLVTGSRWGSRLIAFYRRLEQLGFV